MQFTLVALQNSRPSHFLLQMADVVNEADMVDGGDDNFTPLRANLKEYEKELRSSLQDFKNEVKKYLYIILICNIVVLAVGIGSIRIANSSHQLTLDDKLLTHQQTLDDKLSTHQLTLDDKLLTHQQTLDDKLSTHQLTLDDKLLTHQQTLDDKLSTHQLTLDDKLLTHQQTLDGKLSILRHTLAADQIAIKDMHEFLLLQVISGKDVPTILIDHYDTIIGIILNLNYSLAFKHKLHIAWFQFKIQKQKPHIVTGLKWPWKLVVTSRGQIVVSEVDGHSITVIKGNERKQLLNLKGSNKRLFTHPSGVAITSDGYILVTDHHRLQKVSYDGKIKSTFGNIEADSGQQELKYPDGITIHPHTGQVYIADRGNHCIKVLNSDLSYNYSFGEKGSNNGQFNRPTDVAFDSDGYLYVSDRNNNRIQKLTSQGDFVLEFSSKGLSSGRRLKDPSGITIDSYGLVYVKDGGNNDISIFDTSGNFWDTVSNGYGSGCITINNSTVYICDPVGGNLLIF